MRERTANIATGLLGLALGAGMLGGLLFTGNKAISFLEAYSPPPGQIIVVEQELPASVILPLPDPHKKVTLPTKNLAGQFHIWLKGQAEYGLHTQIQRIAARVLGSCDFYKVHHDDAQRLIADVYHDKDYGFRVARDLYKAYRKVVKNALSGCWTGEIPEDFFFRLTDQFTNDHRLLTHWDEIGVEDIDSTGPFRVNQTLKEIIIEGLKGQTPEDRKESLISLCENQGIVFENPHSYNATQEGGKKCSEGPWYEHNNMSTDVLCRQLLRTFGEEFVAALPYAQDQGNGTFMGLAYELQRVHESHEQEGIQADAYWNVVTEAAKTASFKICFEWEHAWIHRGTYGVRLLPSTPYIGLLRRNLEDLNAGSVEPHLEAVIDDVMRYLRTTCDVPRTLAMGPHIHGGFGSDFH